MISSRKIAVRTLVTALGFYAIWTLITYLLEGRMYTLLRPDAVVARLTYTVVANLIVGIAGGFWLLSRLIRSGTITASDAGLNRCRRTVVVVLVGLLLGTGLYALPGAPSWNPVVLANVFAQVLVVSAAEVIVCWVVIGNVVAALLKDGGAVAAQWGVIVVPSVLFGLYHFAHSPPFNSVSMVLLLSVVGLATGLFYVVSRDVYGTIAFHTMLALYGIVGTLDSEGALGTFESPVWSLLGTAVVTILLLGTGHVWLRSKEGSKGEAAGVRSSHAVRVASRGAGGRKHDD